MAKRNLYVYPNAVGHVHDKMPAYRDCVPLSEDGIKRHFKLTTAAEADYFYMGQFSDGYNLGALCQSQFPHFGDKPEKHIMDIEGDWLGKMLPEWMYQGIISVNGILIETFNKVRHAVVRPTFSTLLVDMARNRHDVFPFTPRKRQFVFSGLPDPYGTRLRMARAVSPYPSVINMTNQFMAPIANTHPARQYYEELMTSSYFALCPRGAGVDSIRFYEACFYGCTPILIGDNMVVGDLDEDAQSWFPRLSEKNSDEEWQSWFGYLLDQREEEVIEDGEYARYYFDTVIRDYFSDPTLYFLKDLEKNGL